ncbi:hypothetical protein JZ751_028380 [Albula glossodonta]|uniref:Transmembrane channel-like protein n=1 Tax=Albula glossodonta TaxID=121402 RepID=A0A8T2NAZ6_9TELE|nr:hypothetical protein JZ751_028380 [Albula glossodonta]
MGCLTPPTMTVKPWKSTGGAVNIAYQMDSEVDYITAPLDQSLPSTPHMGDLLRRRGTRKMSLFPGGGVALGKLGMTEEDIRDEIESEERDLVKELAAMSSRDQIQAIRVLPMSLEDKKHIRSQVLATKQSKHGLQLTCCSSCSEQVSRVSSRLLLEECGAHGHSFRKFAANLASARQALELWQGTMKEVGGKFGTSVLSYFLFLKWLLMFNIFSFLVNFGFITVPQLVQPPNRTNAVNFRGLELLTGAGYFNQSVLYYGGYSDEKIGEHSEYDMQLAYFFTISAYLVMCGVCLIYSMARSFQRNFVLSASGSAWQLLCSWDFSMTNERAIRQRKNNLRVQLKESISEKNQGDKMTMSDKLKQFGIHLGTWFISMGLAAGSCAAVFYLCEYNLQVIIDSQESRSTLTEASTLLLPFVVSLINLVIPLLYSLLSKAERYSGPRTKIYVIILRIGIYFSPLLPIMQMIKLFILFYLKKVSLNQNCQPPRRSGRAAQMQTMFIALLFFPSFVGALSMVGYTVWRYEGPGAGSRWTCCLKPSKHCGPFQGLNSTFQAVSLWMSREDTVSDYSWAVWIFDNMIKSALFFYLITIITLVLIYFFWQVTQGRRLLITLLREQIINEGKDKAFLLDKLQKLQRERQTAASTQRTNTHIPQRFERIQEIEPDYDRDFGGIPGLPHVEENIEPPGPPVASALIQAMIARRQAEEEEEEEY